MSVSELNGFKVSNVARATYNTRTKTWAEEVHDDDLPSEDESESAVPPPSEPSTTAAEPDNVAHSEIPETQPETTPETIAPPGTQWKAMTDVLDEGFNVQHSDVENEGTSKTAPKLMQDFLRHGEECSEIDKEALAIAALDPELELDDTQRDTSYDSLLQRIDRISSQAKALMDDILALVPNAETEAPPPPPEEEPGLTGLFDSCIPMLKSRESNLAVARLLVDGAKESRALSLRLRDLEFSGSEDDGGEGGESEERS